jgi:hypothetical protein
MTDTQAITVRLPGDVYEALRREAFERRTSQTAIITEAVQERLGLRAKGRHFVPRMPLSKDDFEIVHNVLVQVLEAVLPEEGASREGEQAVPGEPLG